MHLGFGLFGIILDVALPVKRIVVLVFFPHLVMVVSCVWVQKAESVTGFRLGMLYQVQHRKKKTIVNISSRKRRASNRKLSAYKSFGRDGRIEIRRQLLAF